MFPLLLRSLRWLTIVLSSFLFCTLAWAGPNDGLPKPTVTLDRSTPRRAFDGFLQATHGSDYARAAHYLDLRNISRSKQANEGPVLAQKLGYVIDRQMTVDLGAVSDAPDGGAGNTAVVVAGTIFVDDEPVPISLSRIRFDDGVQRWVLARTTVQSIPEMYEKHGARGWEDKLPRVLVLTKLFGVELWQWLALVAALLFGWAGGWLVGSLLVGLAKRIAKRTRTEWDDALVEAARGPVRLIVGVGFLWIVDEPLRFSPVMERLSHQIAFPVLVVAVAWLVMSMTGVGIEWILDRLPNDAAAELRSRGLRTQLAVMQRVTSVIVTVVAGAVILMQFEFVRSVGLSLLASAGLVGVVLGFAAQKSLAGIIAGIQLSITQPIRLGDTVVIDGENGTVEELNLTYIVVKIWDERRMIVPIQKILDTTFQNWTKVSPEMTGAITFPVDYTTPVDRLRQEAERIVKADPRWDGRTCTVSVTDLTDKAMIVRVLVTARSADDTWSLRCTVREKLVAFIAQWEGGRYLSQLRSRALT